MAVYDRETGRLIPEFYTWDDYTQWDPGADLTWDFLDGSYTSSLGEPDLTFTTEIIDFGRIAYINPLCTAITSGTHAIKVYAADSIDSSSALPGDAVITVSSSGQVLPAIQARYFQFVIEVFDGVDSFVRGVRTNLSATPQTEIIAGDSATHGGTQAARIAPLTKEYSVITGVVGNAKATGSITPFVTIGNNTTQAVYTVYDFTDAQTEDSSTEVGIADLTENVTITVSGATTDEIQYKWEPSAVLFTSSSDKISFTAPSSGNTYTYEMWMKVLQSGGEPGYNHAEYFLRIPVSGSAIRLRTSTEENKLRVDISTDDGSNWTNGAVTDNANDVFRHIAIVGTGSQIKLFVDGTLNTTVTSSQTPSGTVEIGDLGTGGTGYFWMDDFRISDSQRYSSNFLVPGEHVIDADTMMLVNGLQPTVTAAVASSIQTVDATVNLLVTGLPKMVSDANNNIIEQ